MKPMTHILKETLNLPCLGSMPCLLPTLTSHLAYPSWSSMTLSTLAGLRSKMAWMSSSVGCASWYDSVSK